jgi:hypothetical protein
MPDLSTLLHSPNPDLKLAIALTFFALGLLFALIAEIFDEAMQKKAAAKEHRDIDGIMAEIRKTIHQPTEVIKAPNLFTNGRYSYKVGGRFAKFGGQ